MSSLIGEGAVCGYIPPRQEIYAPRVGGRAFAGSAAQIPDPEAYIQSMLAECQQPLRVAQSAPQQEVIIDPSVLAKQEQADAEAALTAARLDVLHAKIGHYGTFMRRENTVHALGAIITANKAEQRARQRLADATAIMQSLERPQE